MGNFLHHLLDTVTMNSTNDISRQLKRPCEDEEQESIKLQRTERNGNFDCEDRSCDDEDNESIHFNELPYPLLLKIFKYLPLYDLVRRASLVCTFWKDLACDHELWRIIRLKHQMKVDVSILFRLTQRSDNVTFLDVSDIKLLTDEGFPQTLQQCKTLQTLLMTRCDGIRSVSLMSIADNCKCLKHLDLEGCYPLSDKTLTAIASGCKELSKLVLSSCPNITSDGIIALANNCPNIYFLSLDMCCKVNDSCLKSLVIGCPRMECLCLSACDMKTEELMVLGKFEHLRVIELARISNLRDDCVIHLVNHCRKLESINVSLCTQITDKATEAIARNGFNMKRVYLVSCAITDQALMNFGKFSSTMECVDVGWCPQITDNGVLFITSNCKSLNYLGLMRCDKVDDRLLERLVKQYPNIYFSNRHLDFRRLLDKAIQEGFLSDCPADHATTVEAGNECNNESDSDANSDE